MNVLLAQAGLLCTALAYVTWGLTPLFYQFLHEDIEAVEIFALRVVWALRAERDTIWLCNLPSHLPVRWLI